jgi:peroxiredoxin
LRESFDKIKATGATLVAIAPHSIDDTKKFLKTNEYPFELLPDDDGKVFDAYDVTKRLASLGQQPALFIVGKDGSVSFDAIGSQQWDLVGPDELIKHLASA